MYYEGQKQANYGGGFGSQVAAMAQSGFGGDAMAGSTLGGECVKRQAELPEQLERIAKSVEYLHHTVNELESRLSPVTQPEPPQPAQGIGSASPGTPITGYASTMYGHSLRIMHVAERLQDVLRRLEV